MLNLIAIALSASTPAAVTKPDEGKCAATPFTLRKSPAGDDADARKRGTVKTSSTQNGQVLRTGNHAPAAHAVGAGESLKLAINCKGTSAK